VINIGWEDIVKKWLGFCPACKSWRNDSMSKKLGDKFFCLRRINFRGDSGDAQMYVRENLEKFDKLDWHRSLKSNVGGTACGMELLDGEDEIKNLETYKRFTDFREGV